MQKTPTSKIIILKHGGGELANQLWNYISIYAYGLEKNLPVINPSFFEYHSFFRLIDNESAWTKFLSLQFRYYSGRRSGVWSRFWRFVYLLYAYVIGMRKESIVSSQNQSNIVTYLPPSSPLDPLTKLAGSNRAYFIGWLFRDPVGLKKFRHRIISAFRPKQSVEERLVKILTPLREKYKNIIGIHIRQSDYAGFKGGVFVITQSRAREIADELLKEKKLSAQETIFLLTSDGPMESDTWKGLNVYFSKENAVTDLFLLSATDAIIGSDSSFGAFASWYGNIAHIVMTQKPIDWNYYAGHKEFFENKYCTLAHY